MAKKATGNMQRRRAASLNGNHATDHLKVRMSSGYTLIIRRPTMNVIRAVSLKAEELYPMPDPPIGETLETVTGQTYQIAAQDDPAHQAAVERVQQQRLEHLLEYVFQRRLEVEGYEGEDGRQQLVDAFAADLDELREFGTLPADMADLDEWQQTLRLFVVADQADYAALMLAAANAFDDHNITEAEIRDRIAFF